MKTLIYIILLALVVGIVVAYVRSGKDDDVGTIAPAMTASSSASRTETATLSPDGATATSTFRLSSSAFKEGDGIPTQYTCDGKNANPPLSWTGVPADAESLALIVDDPDVPVSSVPSGVFDHWIVFNIPPTATGIAASSAAQGTYGANGSGAAAYTGPCPPDKEHRYFFRLYALDATLPLQKGAAKADVISAMQGHILGQASLVGVYNRPGNK